MKRRATQRHEDVMEQQLFVGSSVEIIDGFNGPFSLLLAYREASG